MLTNSKLIYFLHERLFINSACVTLKAWEKGTILIPNGRLQVPSTFTILQFLILIFSYFGSVIYKRN